MLKSLTLNVSVINFKLFQIQPKGILYITFKLHIGLEIDIAWFTTFLMHINKHNLLDSEKKPHANFICVPSVQCNISITYN